MWSEFDVEERGSGGDAVEGFGDSSSSARYDDDDGVAFRPAWAVDNLLNDR